MESAAIGYHGGAQAVGALAPAHRLGLRTICAPNNAGAFNIVHFICHGLPGALALEDERGLMKIVSTIDLAAALKEGEVQLAVINACSSAAGEEESIAQALVDAGVRSVVAHRWPLIDPAAVLFAQALYRELAAGRSLKVPFAKVKRELAELSGKLDEALQDLIGKQVEGAGDLGKLALARLTIFPQPRMIVEAAQAACGEADGLDALVENGVISLKQGNIQFYTMHSTVVDWAKVHCVALNASEQDVQQRVLSAYAGVVQGTKDYFETPEGDHENIFAMHTWMWTDRNRQALAQLALDCHKYLDVRGYWVIARKWASIGVQAMRSHGDSEQSRRVLAALHFMRAKYQFRQGDTEAALRSCYRSLDLNSQLNDLHAQAGNIHLIGRIHVTLEKPDEALALFQQSLALYKQIDERKGEGVILHEIAEIYRLQEQYDTALQLYQESYNIKRELHDIVNAAATFFQ